MIILYCIGSFIIGIGVAYILVGLMFASGSSDKDAIILGLRDQLSMLEGELSGAIEDNEKLLSDLHLTKVVGNSLEKSFWEVVDELKIQSVTIENQQDKITTQLNYINELERQWEELKGVTKDAIRLVEET